MSNTKKIVEDFDWDVYLAQTNAVTAPVDCFWQAPDPPPNKFDDEMILEAYDPRFPSIRCIAEVTAVYGPKIRLRMLGASDNDDIWIIVDSHQIRPIGTADSQGILIQAPFNITPIHNRLYLRGNVFRWKFQYGKVIVHSIARNELDKLLFPVSFILKLDNDCLCDAARFSKMKKTSLAAGNHAPLECFINEPPKPACNMFQIGQKLEACDTRDPVFVCPATVKDVKDEKILVEFDGWNTSEWFRYDSRDIFPVGWWQRSGAKTQNVPSKRTKRGGHQAQKNRESLARVVTTAASSETPTTPDVVFAPKQISSVVDKLNGDIGNLFDRTTSNSDEGASKVQASSASILPVDEADIQSFPLVTAQSTTAAEKCFGIVKPRAKKTIAAASVAPMMRPVKSKTPPLSSPGYITQSPVSRRCNYAPLSAGQLSSIEDAVESVLAASGGIGSHPTTNNDTQNTKRMHSPVQRPSSAAELDVNGRHRSSAQSKQQSSLINNSPLLDGTPDTCDFVVYLNAHCSTGRYLDGTKFLSVRNTRFGPSGVNHVMRACLQMLIDSAHPGDAATVLNCCTCDSSGSGPSLSADSKGSTLMRRLPVFKSQLDAWKYLAQVLDRLHTCPHLLAKRYDSCAACEPAHPSQPLSKKAKLSPTVDALFLDTNGAPSGSATGSGAILIRGRHISGGSSSSTGTERGSTPNVNSITLNDVSKWTVDEVTRFVYNASDSATADLFKRQEIDGKALLLLSADMMIRYMNVRLGPALKISNAIEGAKSGKTQNF